MKDHATDRRRGEAPHGHTDAEQWFETSTGNWSYADPAVHAAALHAWHATDGAVDLAELDDRIEAREWAAPMLRAVLQRRARLVQHMIDRNVGAAREAFAWFESLPFAIDGDAARVAHDARVAKGLYAHGKDEQFADNIRRAIEDNPTMSNVGIAGIAGCSEATVRNYKQRAKGKP